MPRCTKCKEKFEPKTFNRKFCYKDECNDAYFEFLKAQAIKKAEQDKRKHKKENKRKQDYEKDLERVFNEFIRLRDKDEPCISCDKPPNQFKLTAGHYFPAGSNKSVRFDENNVHGQCWFNCNKNQHGNLSEYQPRLVKKIGQEAFDELSRKRHEKRGYTIPELQELIVVYKEKVKKLKNSSAD